ncbi:DNA primase [Kangiella geojedonensis]|uniref:DNA primase n=1 Tax=Kangiella geojedonensis TaxID=914150 RepID=A0A0F6TPQ7_9GAMM|nr:DNA primase [Kangiella geojedonensis]AKE51385.1 DNA primase [Kangiella geojedonensis]
MALIPQQFIQELLARIDIVDLIDSRVPLKKAGTNYKACCPFHGEKTPSFTVSQDKQFYHCFGCGVHGNAIGFIMEYDRLEFPDAVEELATSLGMEVPRDESAPNRPKVDVSLYELMEKIAKFYHRQLSTPQGKVAVDYLKKRGLSGEIAKQFAIGYVPGEWRNLEKIFPKLGTDQKLQQQLIDCGMLIKKETSVYDRFRDRIMFPIKDKRGRVIAFGGRIINDGEPKYLNSPETPIFHKSNELYGLYQARQANRKLQRLLIVEGYMDVVALAQFGINNAVATLGTATTESHLQQLFRATRELVLCFDGDRAGRDAALRALEHGLAQLRDGREIKLMFLPDGEDPDSMVRQVGKEQFIQQVESATPLFEFLLEHLASQVDLESVSGRGQLVHLAKPYLEKVTDPIYHEFFSNALAQRARLSVEKLEKIIEQPAPKPQPAPTQKPAQASQKTNKTMQLALTLLLQNPSLGLNIHNFAWLKTLPDMGPKLLQQLLEIIHKNPNITTGTLLEYWREQEKLYQRLSQLAVTEREERMQGNEEAELQDCMKQLLRQAQTLRLDYLRLKDKQSGQKLTATEKSEYQQLLLLAKQKPRKAEKS